MGIPADDGEFRLGVALSAHQTEGEPVDNDWWRWAKAGRLPDPGEGLAFLHHHKEDFRLLRRLGYGLVRFSVEWARVEPRPGQFAAEALGRYEAVLRAAEEEGLRPLVTLHHFTLPGWLVDQGGILAPSSTEAFVRYARQVVSALTPSQAVFLTVNEPVVLAAMGYLFGRWPPFQRQPRLFLKAVCRLAAWHRQAYRALKAEWPGQKVGLVKHLLDFRASSPWAAATAFIADRLFHEGFLRLAGPIDVLGCNYYTTAWIDPFGRLLPARCPETEMGWEIAPEGMARLLWRLRRTAKECYVTENGIATLDEGKRLHFIRAHLAVVARLIGRGCPIRGYCYWTLFDNYEWLDGYERHFGLGDRQRRLRPAASALPRIWAEEWRNRTPHLVPESRPRYKEQ